MRPLAPAGRRILPATVLLAACGVDAAPDPGAIAVRDSAGVTVVDNLLPRLDALELWTLAPAAVTLGSADGDPAHQFSEVVGAVVLPDGRFLVGDAETRELRIFDGAGTHAVTFAGRGEGPGELPWLYRFAVHGETIHVSAWPFGFLTRFGLDGDYLDSRQIGPFWPGRTSAILSDGSLLLDYYDGGHGNNIELWAAQGGEPTFRATGALIRAYEDGSSDTLRAVQGEEWFKRGTWRVDLWLSPTPFGPATLSAVSEPRVYVGETDRSELEVRRLDGRLERIVRWSAPPVPVTRADRREHAEGLRASLRQPARAAELEKWIAEAPYPDTKQAFVDLAADRSGRLWVALPPTDAKNSTWLVFSPAGDAVARAEVPRGGRLLDVGADYALVLLSDDLDVERIERRPIIRPSR